MNAIVRRFVLKDLHFARGVMIGAVLIALLAIPLLTLGPVGRYAAFILMIVAGAAPGSFICGALVVTERKERSNLFALALPISPVQATLAKALAAVTAYLVPWAVLMAGTFALFYIAHSPKGLLPLGTMVWVFLLDQFCLQLAVSLTTSSDALFTTVIVFCSVSISMYFYVTLSVPTFAAQLPQAAATWSPMVFKVIAIELLIAVALLAYTFWRVSRQKDFV